MGPGGRSCAPRRRALLPRPQAVWTRTGLGALRGAVVPELELPVSTREGAAHGSRAMASRPLMWEERRLSKTGFPRPGTSQVNLEGSPGPSSPGCGLERVTWHSQLRRGHEAQSRELTGAGTEDSLDTRSGPRAGESPPSLLQQVNRHLAAGSAGKATSLFRELQDESWNVAANLPLQVVRLLALNFAPRGGLRVCRGAVQAAVGRETPSGHLASVRLSWSLER